MYTYNVADVMTHLSSGFEEFRRKQYFARKISNLDISQLERKFH